MRRNGHDKALGGAAVLLANLELDLERRGALENEDEVVRRTRCKLVVDAEAVLCAVRKAGARKRPDVLLNADNTLDAALRRFEPVGVGTRVQGVSDTAEDVRVVTRRGGEEGEVGARLDCLERVRASLAVVRALLQRVRRLERGFACRETNKSETAPACGGKRQRTLEEHRHGVDRVGAHAGTDHTPVPRDLSDAVGDPQGRPRQRCDVPLGLGNVAGAVLVAHAQKAVRAGARVANLNLAVGISRLEARRCWELAVTLGRRLIRNDPRLCEGSRFSIA